MSLKQELLSQIKVDKIDLVVAGLIANEDKILLIHHNKLDKWIPPGGHIQENETPDEALEREIKEELNLEIEIIKENELSMGGSIKKQLALPFYVNLHNVGDHDHCCFFYLCKPKDMKKVIADKSEVKNYHWFSIDELNNNNNIPFDVKEISSKAVSLLNST